MRATLPVVLISTALLGCNVPAGNLSGEWIGENYQCPDANTLHREKIRVTEADGAIEAVKITGDECVPAGQVSFKGSREKLSCIIGLPGKPANGEVAGAIKIVNADTFEACSVRFVRP